MLTYNDNFLSSVLVFGKVYITFKILNGMVIKSN